MATLKTINRIKDFLIKVDKPVTPTDISRGVNIKWDNVNECLKFLENYGFIQILTNGRFRLIVLKQNCEVIKWHLQHIC